MIREKKSFYYSRRGTFECDAITASSCDRYKKYQSQLESRRQYTKGETIKSISEFSEYIKDNSYVFFFFFLKHIRWFISLQYLVLKNLINHRCPVCGRRVRSGKGSSSFVRDKRCQDCGQILVWK